MSVEGGAAFYTIEILFLESSQNRDIDTRSIHISA
jgi:hypothetical protein